MFGRSSPRPPAPPANSSALLAASEEDNQSLAEASAELLLLSFLFFFFLFLPFLSPPLPACVRSLSPQQSLVDLGFEEARVAVVLHQSIDQPLRPVEAIWRRARDVFADFLPRHAVNVYL